MRASGNGSADHPWRQMLRTLVTCFCLASGGCPARAALFASAAQSDLARALEGVDWDAELQALTGD